MANHRSRPFVVVLGAGLAGLAAADRLIRAGCRVTVLEAQNEVGGRARRLDHPFAPGLVAECGPARFPADFTRVIALARRFHLELEPFYPREGSIVGWIGGRRTVGVDPDNQQFWGYRLHLGGLRALLWSWRGRLPQRMYHVQGGTHRLPQALAASLDAEFRMERRATFVHHRAAGVVVESSGPHGDEELEADAAVCAVPLSRVSGIDFWPTLEADRLELIERIGSMAAVRVFFQMSRPFWREEGLNGFAITDTIGEVWAPRFSTSGSSCLMVCYAQRELAEQLCAMSSIVRIEYVLSELEKIFPGAARHVEDAAT